MTNGHQGGWDDIDHQMFIKLHKQYKVRGICNLNSFSTFISSNTVRNMVTNKLKFFWVDSGWIRFCQGFVNLSLLSSVQVFKNKNKLTKI